MSKPDYSLDPLILESAKKEFLANGFEKASLIQPKFPVISAITY